MTSIDVLPDDVLLEIFDIYVYEHPNGGVFFKGEIEEWQTLVHVCRRWRSVVFGSPRRLNLRLVCTATTPARDTLDLWPSLPLFILIPIPISDLDIGRDSAPPERTEDVDEILAVLKRIDRVVKIHLLNVNDSDLEDILAAMQVPFPELTDLQIRSPDGKVAIPNSFLDGSAPPLESLLLNHVPFPGLPKLLLSAPHLVYLHLVTIPHSGYISPEAMVTAVSTLTNLDYLSLEFESPRSRPDWASRPPPPLTRFVLPVLRYFSFKGVGEYLDDFVACFDAPRLKISRIAFFNQIIFDTPQFTQFISRAPSLKALEKAKVRFMDGASRVSLSSQTPGYGVLSVEISCMELDWQVSSMEQVCTSCLSLSTLEDLYIHKHSHSTPVWQDNIENELWLELLQPFTAVKNLYLCEKFTSHIMPALQELVGGRTTEVLPILQNIFLKELQPSGTLQACIQQFVTTRQANRHPIAVSRWDHSEEDMATYD